MATISDLHKSISSMTNEELEQKFLDIRKNIRITKKAFKGDKTSKVQKDKKVDIRSILALLSPEELEAFKNSITK